MTELLSMGAAKEVAHETEGSPRKTVDREATLKKKLLKAQERVLDVEQKHSMLSVLLHEHETRAQKAEEERDDLQMQLAAATTENEARRNSVEEASESLRVAKEEALEMGAELERIQLELDASKQQASAAAATHAAEADKLATTLKQREGAMKQLQTDIASSRTEVESLTEQLKQQTDSLNEANAATTKERDKLTKMLKQQETETMTQSAHAEKEKNKLLLEISTLKDGLNQQTYSAETTEAATKASAYDASETELKRREQNILKREQELILQEEEMAKKEFDFAKRKKEWNKARKVAEEEAKYQAEQAGLMEEAERLFLLLAGPPFTGEATLPKETLFAAYGQDTRFLEGLLGDSKDPLSLSEWLGQFQTAGYLHAAATSFDTDQVSELQALNRELHAANEAILASPRSKRKNVQEAMQLKRLSDERVSIEGKIRDIHQQAAPVTMSSPKWRLSGDPLIRTFKIPLFMHACNCSTTIFCMHVAVFCDCGPPVRGNLVN